jgi:hypothetical protein
MDLQTPMQLPAIAREQFNAERGEPTNGDGPVVSVC